MLLQLSSKDKSSCSSSSSPGQPRVLEGPRAKYNYYYAVTALIEYLTVLLEYIDLLRAISRVGPRATCPSCPPPSRRPCPVRHWLSNILCNAQLPIFIPGNLPIIPKLFFMLSYSNYSQNYSGIIDGSLLMTPYGIAMAA